MSDTTVVFMLGTVVVLQYFVVRRLGAQLDAMRRQRDIYRDVVLTIKDMPVEEVAERLGVRSTSKVYTTDSIKRKFGLDN